MEKIKVVIPDNIGDITLEKYLRYQKICERTDLSALESDRRIISLFLDIPYQKVIKMASSHYEEVKHAIVKALDIDVKFVHTFKMDGIEWGFEPNLNEISIGHNGDLTEYQGDPDNAHRFLAALFRPIVKKDAFGNYEIEPYSGTNKYCEVMKKSPMHIYKGAVFFFTNLAKDLLSNIQRSTAREIVKGKQQRSISKNGIGMQL